MPKRLHLWRVVSICAKLRIKTDNFSDEPIQCGYNMAYTNLGIARFNQNDIDGAIDALYISGQVWPCPHKTSFGLSDELVNKLKNIPKADKAVKDYIEIASLFTRRTNKILKKFNALHRY